MNRRAMLLQSLLFPFAGNGSARGAQDATPVRSQSNLSGIAPLDLIGERRAAFEAYIAASLLRFGVPGASVAVVQHGEVVYLNAFGVKALGGTQPITPDTLMAIGSITKSMTTMLAGTLVDDDRLTWGTPLIALLPEFAVGDAELTRSLTVRDAFCNCTGLPGRDLPAYFNGSMLSPEWTVTALADVAPTAAKGQRFAYNNALIAAGGYALGLATGAGEDDIGLAYDTALRERVLAPIDMPLSTFSVEDVTAAGDFAMPHAYDLTGEMRQLSILTERWLAPVRPAGGLWSSARELARWLQTEMARGVAPNGTRVVSSENLEEAWAPGIAVPNLFGGPPQVASTMAHYGLGWMVGDYRGLRILNHAGGTMGYTAVAAFLPEAGLGFVILTNANALSPAHMPLGFVNAVQFRLFELLFEQPSDLSAAIEATPLALPLPELGRLNPEEVTPYLGRYDSTELGDVTLLMRDGRLVLDVGESSSELRPRAGGDGNAMDYLLVEQPLASLSQLYGASIQLSGGASEPHLAFIEPANPTGPEQQIVFEPVTSAERACG